MDQPSTPAALPKITRTFVASRSSTRQQMLSDDLFSNLTPETTLKAITTPSGHLKDSIESATPNERAFGLRAVDASKKIHMWTEELLSWPWPKVGGQTGFEMLPVKSEIFPSSKEPTTIRYRKGYIYTSGLLESQIYLYEKRIEEISADLENLDMDELKRQILDTHFSPRSIPSHSFSKIQTPNFISSTPFNEIDDFTALVTATVLQTLPTLNKLVHLIQSWSIRLVILRRVPGLMLDMDDADIALKSGWNAIQISEDYKRNASPVRNQGFSRKSYDIIRSILEEKVTNLGKEIDFMLDSLEATYDTLPELWLDRMENLERGYSDWVVAGDRKVREDEWAISEEACTEAQDAKNLESITETAEIKIETVTPEKKITFEVTDDIGKPCLYRANDDHKKLLRLASCEPKKSPSDSRFEIKEDSQEILEHEYSPSVQAVGKNTVDQFNTCTQKPKAADIITQNTSNIPNHIDIFDSSNLVNWEDNETAKLTAYGAYKGEKCDNSPQHIIKSKNINSDTSILNLTITNLSKNKDSLNNTKSHIYSTSITEEERNRNLLTASEFHPESPLELPQDVIREKSCEPEPEPEPEPRVGVSELDITIIEDTYQENTDTHDINFEVGMKYIKPQSIEHTFFDDGVSTGISPCAYTATKINIIPNEDVTSKQPNQLKLNHESELSNCNSPSRCLPVNPTEPGLGTNFSPEISHQIRTAKRILSEKPSVRPLRISELPPRSTHELSTGKMSPVLEESRVLSSCMKMASSVCQAHKTEQDHTDQSTLRENLPLMDILQNSSPQVSNCGCILPKDMLYSLDKLPYGSFNVELHHELGKKPSMIDRIHSEDKGYDISPLDSPSIRINRPRSVSFGPDCSGITSLSEANLLGKIDLSSPSRCVPIKITKGSTDEQIQQCISSLLESISARICLSPDSDLAPHQIKPRQSLTRSSRSTSSLSNHGSYSRASTPSFTLAPVYSKGSSRPRRQHSPEIRVYHLSCSTGEAPIKLFVRLVGENGERVMVRVGGGWADLGEYLKEYASHHGRRVNTDTIKVQDVPQRAVSGSSTTSGTTARPNARTKLLQKPQIASEQYRSKGNLNVRKVRKSFSSGSTESLSLKSALNTFRSPSTPLPAIKHNSPETPPSGASSNGTLTSITSGRSSRMSWNEDDFNLGLAGPRGKSNLISDHDQEWVESMKEKVRLASAEKDRRNRERADRGDRSERERSRGYSFGELEKVGGTKRLFRREGSLF
ncbi:hypothetical protein K3495_g3059 [Podosphaera aphanis]|nr:hypothetical protein K3495_g3059 [Podosphaera aphanis]